MIQQTLEEIEKKLTLTGTHSDETRAELLKLIRILKGEISDLAKTDEEQALSIAGFTGVTTHEATREKPNRYLLKSALDGLSASVVGFEKTHPRLVDVVNAISTTLSNLGI